MEINMHYKWWIMYLLINIGVFLLYGLDKWKASAHRWRISEKTLIAAAVFGILGAYSGMYFFHHKTQKAKFYIGVPVIFVLEIMIILILIKYRLFPF